MLQEANCTAAVIPPHLLPSSDDAVQIYEAAGGHITAPSTFGTDVLANYADLQEARNMEWAVRWPVEGLFQQLVHHEEQAFRDAVMSFQELSYNFLEQG